MNEIILTISQALQLVALAPCIFVMAFLLATGSRNRENILPLLYFASLSCSFIRPLMPIFGASSGASIPLAALMMGESLTAPLSFLLIIQFLKGRMPSWPYWGVLGLPLLGGSSFIYGVLYVEEVCFGRTGSDCYSTGAMHLLYNVFSISMIFLLLIYEISRTQERITDMEKRHKYWLIISLIGLNLVLGALDLMTLGGNITASNALFAGTVIRITFIYLVLTSIFRVFYELFDLSLPISDHGGNARRDAARDQEHIERLKYLLGEERLYREMGLTRKALAQRAGLSEQQASRIINAYFRKNFSELVNSYRIGEAKEQLLGSDSAITVIAFEVGFNSIASFNRVFKESVGASPSEFRAFHKHSISVGATSS